MENRSAALVAAWWLTAAIGLAPAVAAADTLDEVTKRGELIFGGDAEGGGPFVFPRQDDPSQVQGFEIELANLLAAKLGVKARFSQGQWGKLPDLLQRGDIDVVLNGYEWTPSLGQRYAASLPYYVYELQMLVRKNDDRFKQLKDIGTPDLNGKMRIAVLGGSAAERDPAKVVRQRHRDRQLRGNDRRDAGRRANTRRRGCHAPRLADRHLL